MAASVGSTLPEGDGWAFEPKYDGVRVLAHVAPSAIQLVTRNLKSKTRQFPEIIEALTALASKHGKPLILDGEIVALRDGEPARFQELQSRMHLMGAEDIARAAVLTPSSLVVFDLLRDGDEALLDEAWALRRKRLERILKTRKGAARTLRISDVGSDGATMLERARRAGWEGIIAKATESNYQPGTRSRRWLKLKIEHRQELVVGGFTEPRNSREHIGALLLGYYDGDQFVYAGHTGTGFSRATLERLAQRLKPLERKVPAFADVPKTNAAAHWVRPELVVEVKFSEWTADGRLRQPVFVGVRDDKDPRDVRREPESLQRR